MEVADPPIGSLLVMLQPSDKAGAAGQNNLGQNEVPNRIGIAKLKPVIIRIEIPAKPGPITPIFRTYL